MEPGDHIIVLMAGGGTLLFYSSLRSLVEAYHLVCDRAWSAGEFFLFIVIGLPPILIGGALSSAGVAVFVQKLFSYFPQG